MECNANYPTPISSVIMPNLFDKYPLIAAYTDCSRLVNDGHRNGVILNYAAATTNEIIAAINEVSEIGYPHQLYRGVKDLPQYFNAKPGDLIHDNGFMSKSNDITEAEAFCGTSNLILCIRYPANVKQLRIWCEEDTDNDEQEFLTYPGEELVVRERTENIIYCDFVRYRHNPPEVTDDVEAIRSQYDIDLRHVIFDERWQAYHTSLTRSQRF